MQLSLETTFATAVFYPQGRREDGRLDRQRRRPSAWVTASSSRSTSSGTATARSSARIGGARRRDGSDGRRGRGRRRGLSHAASPLRAPDVGQPLPAGAYTVRYLVDTDRPDLPPQGPTKAVAVRGTVEAPLTMRSADALPPAHARSGARCCSRALPRARSGQITGGIISVGGHSRRAAHRSGNACPSVRRDRPWYDVRHRACRALARGGEFRITGVKNRKSVDISFTLPTQLTGPAGATIPLNFNGNYAGLCEIDTTGSLRSGVVRHLESGHHAQLS